MKKKLFTLLFLVFSCLSGYALETMVGDYKYSYDRNQRVATVIGYSDQVWNVVIPEKVTIEYDSYDVITIGAHAFEGRNIMSLSLPKTIKTIGESAFYSCTSLHEVILPEGLETIGEKAFFHCLNLKKLDLPTTLTSIGSEAFKECNKLEIVISRKQTPVRIDNNVFSKSVWNSETQQYDYTPSSATLYVVGGNITSYESKGWNQFAKIEWGEPPLADGETFTEVTEDGVEMTFQVTSAADKTCQVGTGVSNKPAIDKTYQGEITIPSIVRHGGYTVTCVGEYAFISCTGLTNVTIPNSVTAINESAFFSCSGLTSIVLPERIESIAGWAFTNCYKLKKIELPSTLVSIGDQAFSQCHQLGTVVSHISEPFNIAEYTFYGGRDAAVNTLLYVPFGSKSKYKALSGWNQFYKIMEGEPSNEVVVDGLRYMCFVGPNVATVISGSYSNLTEVVIPEKISVGGIDFTVTAIDEKIFFTCYSLTKIELPSTLTSIGSEAFTGCYSLRSVVSRINPPISIEDQTFCLSSSWNSETMQYEYNNPSNAILYVPTGSKSKYEAITGWTKFAKIEEGELATIDKIVYLCNPNSMTATVVEDVSYKDLTEVTIPESVTINGKSFTVTAIGEGAFSGCKIRKVVLSKSLNSIGNSAFANCSMLMSVVSQEDSPTNIDESTFCMSEGVYSDDPETGIPTYNVVYYPSEATLYVPAGSKSNYEAITGWTKFANIIEGGEPKEAKVGNYRYSYDAVSKTAIVIPDDGYKDMTEVAIPNSVSIDGVNYKVVAISASSFSGCTQVTSVTLPEGLERIGTKAISGCEIKSLTLPSTITYIGRNAFYNRELTHIFSNIMIPCVLPEQEFYYDEIVFVDRGNGWIGDELVVIHSNITLYIPFGTKEKYEATSGWDQFTKIEELVKDEEVTYAIEDDNKVAAVAANDPMEKEVVIPGSIKIDGKAHSVTAVNDEAFKDNTALTLICIPETVEEIGDEAFAGCSGLTAIYCYAEEPAAIGSDKATVRTRADGDETTLSSVFAEVNKETCILYVPKNSGDKYRSAEGWKEFQNIIEMESSKSGDANNDGEINNKDVDAAANYIMNGDTKNFIFMNADVKVDRKINAADIVMIVNMTK